jgi:hypothetical protein
MLDTAHAHEGCIDAATCGLVRALSKMDSSASRPSKKRSALRSTRPHRVIGELRNMGSPPLTSFLTPSLPAFDDAHHMHFWICSMPVGTLGLTCGDAQGITR